MSKLLAKPATVGSWVLGTVAWSVGGLIGLLPLVIVVGVLKELLGLSDEATEWLLGLGILGMHLWLWWQVLLGGVLISEALDRSEQAEAVAGALWLLLLVGFQIMCLAVALSIRDEWQHRTMWYT